MKNPCWDFRDTAYMSDLELRRTMQIGRVTFFCLSVTSDKRGILILLLRGDVRFSLLFDSTSSNLHTFIDKAPP